MFKVIVIVIVVVIVVTIVIIKKKNSQSTHIRIEKFAPLGGDEVHDALVRPRQ